MPRVMSRSIEHIAWDLAKVIELGPKILSHTTAPKFRKEALAERITSIVAGCFELLVAEFLSHKIGIGEVTFNEPVEPPGIWWNGRFTDGVPEHAPKGVARISGTPPACTLCTAGFLLSCEPVNLL